MRMKTIAAASVVGALFGFAGARAHGQLAALQQSVPPSAGDKLASESAEAELVGDHDKALRLADDAIKTDPKNPWAFYDRGDALGALHRTDDAIVAFHEAERRYSETEVWGKSIAIWGQANVLSQLGRCDEASPIFERYASLVETVDKSGAEVARQYAKRCSPRLGVR